MEIFNNNNRLHTEVLEDRYGKMEVQLLYQDDEIRESLLIDRRYITRTYAVTFKDPCIAENKNIAAIDTLIKSGKSIGKTFKQNGYKVIKNVIAVYLINIPRWVQLAFDTNESTAKIRIAEFFVQKHNESEMILYGTIAEIYSQHFRKAEINKRDLLQINPPLQKMLAIGFSKKEAENYINNPFSVQWGEEITKHSKEILWLKEKVNAIVNGNGTGRDNHFTTAIQQRNKVIMQSRH